jgi:hypothetical protein
MNDCFTPNPAAVANCYVVRTDREASADAKRAGATKVRVFAPRMTVKRKAAVRPTLVSIAVPHAEPLPGRLRASLVVELKRAGLPASGSRTGTLRVTILSGAPLRDYPGSRSVPFSPSASITRMPLGPRT